MVSPVSGTSAAGQGGIAALHRVHAGSNCNAKAADNGPAPAPATDGVQVSGKTAGARQSLDGLRQALASGDPTAIHRAVHAFRHGTDPVGAVDGSGKSESHREGDHGHGRRALMAALGQALSAGDLAAARKAFADLTARRGGAQADAPATAPAPAASSAAPATPAADAVGPPAGPDPAATAADITAVPANAKAVTETSPPLQSPAPDSTTAGPAGANPLVSLATALASGDLDGARKAFADLSAQHGAGHHHHVHRHHRHDAGAGETAGGVPAVADASVVPGPVPPGPAEPAAA